MASMPVHPADPYSPPPAPHASEPAPDSPPAAEPGLGTPSFVIHRTRRMWKIGPRVLVAIGTTVVLVAAALAVLLTRGGPSGGGKAVGSRPVALEISFTKGEVLAYGMDLKMNGTAGFLGHTQDFTGQITGRVAMRVLRVGPQGVATLLARARIDTGVVNGRPIPAAEPVRHRIRMTTTGRIVRGGSELGSAAGALGPSGGSFDATSQFTPLLPRGRVGPGDSWDTTVDRSLAPVGSGRIRYTTHSTLIRYENVNGVRSALVHTAAQIPLNFTLELGKALTQGGATATTPGLGALAGTSASITYTGSMSTQGDSWVDVADGHLEKTAGFVTFDMQFHLGNLPTGATDPGAFSFTGSMDLTFERLPATPANAAG